MGSNFDVSRQADLARLTQKLSDPASPPRLKRKIRRTRARILEQEKIPQITTLRRRFLAAVRANDLVESEKLAEQLKKYDRKLGLDNRKL